MQISLLNPADKRRWRVYAVDSYGNHIGATYLYAANELKARQAGKAYLKMLGVKRISTVRAQPYYPELDRTLVGYVQEVRSNT